LRQRTPRPQLQRDPLGGATEETKVEPSNRDLDPDELRRKVAQLQRRAADLYHGPRFWISLLITAALTLASILAVAALVINRPTTALIALAFSTGVAYARRHSFLLGPARFAGEISIGGIIGGISAEAVRYLLVGVPLGVPPNVPWFLIGALGIGGGYGFLTAGCAALPVLGIRALVTQYRARRRFVGRAA